MGPDADSTKEHQLALLRVDKLYHEAQIALALETLLGTTDQQTRAAAEQKAVEHRRALDAIEQSIDLLSSDIAKV